MSTFNDSQGALHRITQGARTLTHRLGPAPVLASGSRPKLLPHHDLTLPIPQPITSIFICRGLGIVAAEKLNQIFLDQASLLKQMYEDKHRQIINTWLEAGSFHATDMDKLISATQSAYLHQYDQAMDGWRNKIDEMSRHRPLSTPRLFSLADTSAGVKHGSDKRPTFKIESVPLLEKAYTLNAYPSRTDKEILAEDSGMGYKQVNIWFQNRRARSKKEGLSLQRTATFATQYHTPRVVTISPSSDASTANVCEPLTLSDRSHDDILESKVDFVPSITRPVHAFPTPYPPLYTEDQNGVGSFQTVWPRLCATDSVRMPVVDIEQLISQMADLSLSSDVSSNRTPLPSFTLVLPRAPLPALIRTATRSSRAQPIAIRVSAVGSGSRSGEVKNLYAVPPRLVVGRHASSQASSPTASTRPVTIPHSHSSAARRLHRSSARSPCPPHSSRSSSLSSVASSRTSSWSTASSIGPMTPSTSPRVGTLELAKDVPSPSTLAHAHRSLSISDGVHMLSSFR